MYDGLMKKDGSVTVSDVCSSEVISRIQQLLCEKSASLTDRTAKLWLQYMSMIQILMKFIKAERLVLWELHLQAVTDMLPYLAASGHNLYAKSTRIYLQEMVNLEKSHSDLYEKFTRGFHAS